MQDQSLFAQPKPLQMEPPPLHIEIIETIPPRDPTQGMVFDHAAPADHYHIRTINFPESTQEGGANRGGMGTMAYMPPEQWAADGEVGTPADLYAFGLILSELLGGRHGLADLEAPLNEDGWYQLHLSGTPRPLRNGPAEAASRLPSEIEQLYQALLAKAPSDRPTAEQALGVLQQAAAQLGEQPYSNSNLYPRERHSRRIRWNNWASAQYRFNRYEKALECNDRAFALEPSDPDVLNTRANILSAHGLMLQRSGDKVKGRQLQEEALEMLYQALEETPVSMILGRKRIHSSLALLLNELGRYQESEAEYGESLTLMPDDFYTWRNRTLNLLDWAQVERQNRQISEARRHLKLALQCVRQSDHLGLNSADVAVMVTSIQRELAEIEA
jgi:tetratricopeptide (TPR) repeat protein